MIYLFNWGSILPGGTKAPGDGKMKKIQSIKSPRKKAWTGQLKASLMIFISGIVDQ
jgi:hypothetical protein